MIRNNFMRFNIKRADSQDFRNFVVEVGDKLLIDRNEDFYSELTEWVEGVLSLMSKGTAYFSAPSGFTPFFGALDAEDVHFETVDGEFFTTSFLDVVSHTIVFLYEQAKDESSFQRDSQFFEKKANALMAGFRFRFKNEYKGLTEYLRSRKLMESEVSIQPS